MVPVTRVLQYLFLVAGLALLGVGIFMANGQNPESNVNFTWTCQGTENRQQCAPDAGELDDITTYDADDTGLAVSLGGVGLLVASVSLGLTGVAGRGGAGQVAAPVGYAPQPPAQTPPGSPVPQAPPAQGRRPGRPGGYGTG